MLGQNPFDAFTGVGVEQIDDERMDACPSHREFCRKVGQGPRLDIDEQDD